ncbi:MAG TPA: sugar transferase [Chitinophagaceae bacterium]|jgi:lipopolysaccharide/colanic/teichoic acid biosynthesis glycosyltransferase|nr:sugar transferase [Chitinophagaceae bacterium]
MDSIRCFDVLFAFLGIVILLPFFIVIALLIKLTSAGSILFKQNRVGKNNVDFKLFKFRTMQINAESKGQLTVGGRDSRITNVGYFLRKFKLDELPQLFNVLNGTMSLVGPRPEVRKFVNFYTVEQQKVLLVLPGITDFASIEFRNENELLANATNPEQYYIEVIMPKKIDLNKQFIENRTLKNYFSILFTTVLTSVRGK